jgi:hypothetical protein
LVIGIPKEGGAVHDRVTNPSPEEKAPIVGAAGGPLGLTRSDPKELGPVPIPFVAATVKLYPTPFVSPWIVAVRSLVVVVTPSGVDVTV